MSPIQPSMALESDFHPRDMHRRVRGRAKRSEI